MSYRYTDSLSGATASYPTAVMTPIEFRNRNDGGIPVTNETFSVPSGVPYRVHLNYVPLEQSSIAISVNGVSRILIPFGETVGSNQVGLDLTYGILEFNAADANASGLASYTGKGSVLSSHIVNKTQNEIVATQTGLNTVKQDIVGLTDDVESLTDSINDINTTISNLPTPSLADVVSVGNNADPVIFDAGWNPAVAPVTAKGFGSSGDTLRILDMISEDNGEGTERIVRHVIDWAGTGGGTSVSTINWTNTKSGTPITTPDVPVTNNELVFDGTNWKARRRPRTIVCTGASAASSHVLTIPAGTLSANNDVLIADLFWSNVNSGARTVTVVVANNSQSFTAASNTEGAGPVNPHITIHIRRTSNTTATVRAERFIGGSFPGLTRGLMTGLNLDGAALTITLSDPDVGGSVLDIGTAVLQPVQV